MTTTNSIVHRQEDYERQPMVLLVVGETGVGKTRRNKLEIRRYLQDMPSIGKAGRPVLAFDTNDDDYPEFSSVSPDHLHQVKAIKPRRIRPFNVDGSPMTHEEKKEVVKKIVSRFRGGLVVLDDIDHYMAGAKGQAIISALVSVRHMGVDLLLCHQSASKLTTTSWEASNFIRFHHIVDSVTRYKNRIPNYPIIRIAQIIVNEQYNKASQAFALGKITKKEAIIHKSFCVYVNTRALKIIGCSKGAFIRATIKFINQEESSLIRSMMNEWTFGKKSKLKYKDRNEAVLDLLKQYMRFYEERDLKPFDQEE